MWALFLSGSPCPSHFSLGFLTHPTCATDHPFVSVAGVEPFHKLIFPLFAAAANSLLVYTPHSFYFGLLHFDWPAWKVDVSDGPTEWLHTCNLAHVNQEGHFAGSKVKQLTRYMNGSSGTVRLLIKGVWLDTTVRHSGEFFHLIVPALCVLLSVR
jgi:hypothetical protein